MRGGALPAAHRALDRGGEAGVRPVPGEEEAGDRRVGPGPQRLDLGAGGEGREGLAQDERALDRALRHRREVAAERPLRGGDELRVRLPRAAVGRAHDEGQVLRRPLAPVEPPLVEDPLHLARRAGPAWAGPRPRGRATSRRRRSASRRSARAPRRAAARATPRAGGRREGVGGHRGDDGVGRLDPGLGRRGPPPPPRASPPAARSARRPRGRPRGRGPRPAPRAARRRRGPRSSGPRARGGPPQPRRRKTRREARWSRRKASW